MQIFKKTAILNKSILPNKINDIFKLLDSKVFIPKHLHLYTATNTHMYALNADKHTFRKIEIQSTCFNF